MNLNQHFMYHVHKSVSEMVHRSPMNKCSICGNKSMSNSIFLNTLRPTNVYVISSQFLLWIKTNYYIILCLKTMFDLSWLQMLYDSTQLDLVYVGLKYQGLIWYNLNYLQKKYWINSPKISLLKLISIYSSLSQTEFNWLYLNWLATPYIDLS